MQHHHGGIWKHCGRCTPLLWHFSRPLGATRLKGNPQPLLNAPIGRPSPPQEAYQRLEGQQVAFSSYMQEALRYEQEAKAGAGAGPSATEAPGVSVPSSRAAGLPSHGLRESLSPRTQREARPSKQGPR